MNARLSALLHNLRLSRMPRTKRIVVALFGGTVLLIGICLIVLPGPAMLVIPAGLAILATEFVWARRWLHKVRDLAGKAKGSFKRQAARRWFR
jgi:hypothetical protein